MESDAARVRTRCGTFVVEKEGMRVLLTGAGGNLGRCLIPELLARGHSLRTFDLPSVENRRTLAARPGQLQPCWGDLRDEKAVRAALGECDAIVHLGAVTPPASELAPEEARSVNVEGTRNVIAAAQTRPTAPRLVFPSSVAVYGRAQPEEPRLLGPDTPLDASDHYSAHKIQGESELRQSGLPHIVLRLGISLPQRPSRGDPRWFGYLFEHSLDSRVHFLHPRDAAHAIAQALECAWPAERVLCVAGGDDCRITLRELLAATLEAVGLGMLPESAFGERPLFGDWMDTQASQRVLGDYQRHAWADFARELRQTVGFRRWGVGLLAPFARSYMLRHSVSYQRSRQR